MSHMQLFQLNATLMGHTMEVNGLAFSHDDSFFISASSDRRLIVWDLQRGVQLRVLEGHPEWVTCVVISPDDRTAASGCYDGSVRLWCLRTGTCLRVIHMPSYGGIIRICHVNCLAFCPEGSSLAMGGNDFYRSLLQQWSVDVSSTAPTRPTHNFIGEQDMSSVQCVMYTSSTQMVSGGIRHGIRVWDLASGTCTHMLMGVTLEVTGMSLLKDGSVIVSASLDGAIMQWGLIGLLQDGIEWECDTSFLHHTSSRRMHCMSGSLGVNVAVSGSDDVICVWDLITGNCKKVLEGHTGRVAAVAMSGDGKTVISGGADNMMKVWRLYE